LKYNALCRGGNECAVWLILPWRGSFGWYPNMRNTIYNPFKDVVRSSCFGGLGTIGVQDVRLRFKRSTIGATWIFLNLTIMVLAVGFIYASLLGQNWANFFRY